MNETQIPRFYLKHFIESKAIAFKRAIFYIYWPAVIGR